MGILTEKEIEDLRKWEDRCIEKYGYYLHALVNGEKSGITGEVCNDFIPGYCDIHSHGLEMKNIQNLRIVSDYGLSLNNLQDLMTYIVENHCNHPYKVGDSLIIHDATCNFHIGYFIQDPDDDTMLRLIRDIPEDYTNLQHQKLEMLKNTKGLLN